MKTKKIVSLLMAMLLALSCLSVSASAFVVNNYKITNPYENIDWKTVKQYKTALHTHTNQSDGDPTVYASLERHAEAGFDMVATTDHGTTSYTWEDTSENKLIYGALSLVGKSEGDLVALGKEGKFNFQIPGTWTAENKKGTLKDVSYKVETVSGDEYVTFERNGAPAKMMRIPYGIENNAVSANAHVNSWFVDYRDNSLTTYESCFRGLAKAGDKALCVINHPGEYSKARYEIHSEDAYNTKNFSYWYLVNKFAKLIDKYDFCIGVDVNSKGDGRTRFDRILWDVLLERFSAKGENVYAICSSDAHQLNKIDTGFVYALAGEQTSEALRNAMKNGELIAASHCNGNPDELKDIANGVKKFYGETEFYTSLTAMTAKMDEMVQKIENGDEDPDEDISYTYDFCLNDANDSRYFGVQPMITGITAEYDTITISSENALIVRWISNGKQIACTKASATGSELFLDDYSADLGDYVRAEVIGEGGILYTQAFLLNADAKDKDTRVVDKGYFNFGFIDCLFAIVNNWIEILGRVF